MTDGMILDDEENKRLYDLTTKIYHRACHKYGYSNRDLKMAFYDDKISYEEYQQKAEELDAIYREMLCKLPSSALSNIVEGFKAGQQNRAQKTIDTITTELLERELKKNEEKGDT